MSFVSMLQLLTALTLFSVVLVVQGLSHEEISAIRDKCLKEEGFTDEPKFIGVGVTDMRIKCYTACVLREYGVMKESGAIDLDKILEQISDTKNKDVDLKKRLLMPCIEKKGENDCDTGYLITNCVSSVARRLDE